MQELKWAHVPHAQDEHLGVLELLQKQREMQLPKYQDHPKQQEHQQSVRMLKCELMPSQLSQLCVRHQAISI